MGRWDDRPDDSPDDWRGWKSGKYDNRYSRKSSRRRFSKNSYRKKQIKKIGIGIAIVAVIGFIGFLFANDILEINLENLEKSIETISNESPQIIRDTSSQIQEKSSEFLKKLEEEQKQRAEEQKLADEKYVKDIALKIHDLVNEQRSLHSQKALGWNSKIAQASLNHSQDMATRNYFAHDSPERQDFTFRYAKVGFECNVGGGENIFYLEGYYGEDRIAKTVVDGWMNSDGHRQNILRSYFTSEGIGVAISESGKVYVTEGFC